MVATHLAHKSLLLAECSTAVSTGSNIMLRAGTTAAICQLQALSPVGRCKSFEASADGYGRGEGVATLVMCRPLEAQLAALHMTGGLQAVIHGSALNQGGRSSSLTAPNGPAQSKLVREALEDAGLPIESIKFVSVHGTGTPLGDPIEIGGLMQVLGDGMRRPVTSADVVLLSNKSCYGHTEGTAGITSLLLATAALNNLSAPQVMHLRDINPYVSAALDTGPSHHSQMRPMRQAGPALASPSLVAGCSSFGMSGVNAHMLMSSGAEHSTTENKVLIVIRLLKECRFFAK